MRTEQGDPGKKAKRGGIAFFLYGNSCLISFLYFKTFGQTVLSCLRFSLFFVPYMVVVCSSKSLKILKFNILFFGGWEGMAGKEGGRKGVLG